MTGLAGHPGESRDQFSRVIPGHRAAMNPEAMHTEGEKRVSRLKNNSSMTVFMGSGLGPAGRPGMTKIVSNQIPRSASPGRVSKDAR